MFGVDVGTLRILLASSSSSERVVWRLTGDAGNAWFRGAVTLAEPQPFRVRHGSWHGIWNARRYPSRRGSPWRGGESLLRAG